MKIFSMVLGFLAAVVIIWNIVPCNLQVFAREGCCKERLNKEDHWSANGKTYSECIKDNKEKDGDKVTDESGLIWWDKAC